ncbi:MAG: hypothetical protein ACXAC7_13545 [Candidatus Hodarchaeales archaeon]
MKIFIKLINNKTKIIFIFLIISLGLNTIIFSSSTTQKDNNDIKHSLFFPKITAIDDPFINLDNNTDFSIQAGLKNWPGNGTEINPYLIANISVTTVGGSGIIISNTDVYFSIINVTIQNATNFNEGAFILSNVSNGKLINNSAYNCNYGFYIDQSHNISLENNTAQNNSNDGIFSPFF